KRHDPAGFGMRRGKGGHGGSRRQLAVEYAHVLHSQPPLTGGSSAISSPSSVGRAVLSGSTAPVTPRLHLSPLMASPSGPGSAASSPCQSSGPGTSFSGAPARSASLPRKTSFTAMAKPSSPSRKRRPRSVRALRARVCSLGSRFRGNNDRGEKRH